MQAIILCGGLSTRLGDITKDTPKILLEIGNRTILDIQLELLKEAEVDQVILASGHLHQVLYDQIGELRSGVKIQYAKEEKRLGTGGAIKNAMRHISTEPFFALNGDILIKDFSVSDMLEKFAQKMEGMILATPMEDVRDFGEIVSNSKDKITAFKEKQEPKRSGYINGGVYLFNQSIENYFPPQDNFSVERDVFPLAEALYAFQTEAELIDVGVPHRLEYARKHFGNS